MNMLHRGAFTPSALLSAVLAVGASGQIIDFETKPDGAIPIDNEILPLGTRYQVPFNGGTLEISIGFDVDGDGVSDTPPRFEATGNDSVTGFSGFNNGNDRPAPEFEDQLGDFFLRSASALNDPAPVGTMIIEYSQAVPGFSGEIWDIDGPEQWRVRAFRSGEMVPAQEVLSPLGGLGSEPWLFSVGDPLSGVVRIEIDHIGSRPNNQLGLAFNNFSSTTSIPGPTLLTQQPETVACNDTGVTEVTLYWDEPVVIGADDVSVVTSDALAQPVPFRVLDSGAQAVTIEFRGEPGGSSSGTTPLISGSYTVTVSDRARAISNNAPIDGNADGIAGGDLEVTVTHAYRVDFDENGLLNFFDAIEFLNRFDALTGTP
ncbi:MAG: hypothetical protein AAGG07_11750 [Planctomycetota bacterium]